MDELMNRSKDELKASLETNEWVLPTNLGVIEQTDEAFVKRLKENGWSSSEIKDLELAFHEALVNAIVHGNFGIVKTDNNGKTLGELVIEKQKLFATGKKVHITLDVRKDRIYVNIKDDGEGFNFEKIHDPTTPEGLKETKSRGRFLMKKAFDSVQYLGNGNEVVMIKERKK